MILDDGNSLERAGEELTEVMLLLRSRGDQMRDEALELVRLWPDSRGQRFRRADLEPMLECKEEVIRQSASCARAASAAHGQVDRGERLLQQAVVHLDESAGLRQAIVADARCASVCATSAEAHATEALHKARRAKSLLNGLRNPPL